MYIKINLLPPEIKARWEHRRKKHNAMVLAGTVLAVFLVVYGVLWLATLQVRSEVARLQQERLDLESKFPALQQYAQLQNQIRQAESMISQAVGTSPDWAFILKNIGARIPANVWLTDLAFTVVNENNQSTGTGNSSTAYGQFVENLAGDVNDLAQNMQGVGNDTGVARPEPGYSGELTARGYALDYAAVTQWLEQIRQMPEIAGVNCQFSSREELNGEPVIRFEIKALVLAGQPAG